MKAKEQLRAFYQLMEECDFESEGLEYVCSKGRDKCDLDMKQIQDYEPA
jgi:hypothetical protein